MRPRNGNAIPTAKDGYPKIALLDKQAELRMDTARAHMDRLGY